MNALAGALRRIGRRTPRGRPLVVAHRGASKQAPENTLAAFELAIEDGADAVELDVRLTSDDELVVMHDARLGRTVRDLRLVADVCAGEITALDAGGWHSEKFRGEAAPLLGQALAALRGRAVPIVEIKDNGDLGAAAAREVARLVSGADDVLVASRWPEVLAVVAEESPGTSRLVVAATNRTARSELVSGPHSGCLVWWKAFSSDLAEEARERDVLIAPWVVPNDMVMRFAKGGAGAILTDEPARVLEILEGGTS